MISKPQLLSKGSGANDQYHAADIEMNETGDLALTVFTHRSPDRKVWKNGWAAWLLPGQCQRQVLRPLPWSDSRGQRGRRRPPGPELASIVAGFRACPSYPLSGGTTSLGVQLPAGDYFIQLKEYKGKAGTAESRDSRPVSRRPGFSAASRGCPIPCCAISRSGGWCSTLRRRTQARDETKRSAASG